jgi:hypothetical protein
MKKIIKQLKKLHAKANIFFDGILYAVQTEHMAYIYRVRGKQINLEKRIAII